MNPKEKVLVILTPGFAASEADTSCLPMQQRFVKAISQLHPEISIMVLSFHYPFFRKTYNWFNVSITSFNGRNSAGLAGVWLRNNIKQALNKIHNEKQVIGILSFWLGECAHVGKTFADKNGLKHYCWLLGQDAKAKNKYMAKLGLKANELIALSDFLQDEFERNYKIKPSTVIVPGILKQEQNGNLRDIDLFGVGSLIPLKQFGIFIEVVASIRKQFPKVKVLLAGDGPDKHKLRKLISDLGLESNIDLIGSVPHQEILDMMQRTKILLHPSSYEGFSGVCQEALSCGTHVISFCRAMNNDIRQWHIVQSKNAMIEKALSILNDNSLMFEPVKFQTMATTAQQIMNCYLKESPLLFS